MSSTLNEASLRERLQRLDGSKDAITGMSQYLMLQSSNMPRVVQLWEEELASALPTQQLYLLYLANDILQNSKKRRSQAVVDAWAEGMPAAIASIGQTGLSIFPQARKVLNILRDRAVLTASFVEKLLLLLEDPDSLNATDFGSVVKTVQVEGGSGQGAGATAPAPVSHHTPAMPHLSAPSSHQQPQQVQQAQLQAPFFLAGSPLSSMEADIGPAIAAKLYAEERAKETQQRRKGGAARAAPATVGTLLSQVLKAKGLPDAFPAVDSFPSLAEEPADALTSESRKEALQEAFGFFQDQDVTTARQLMEQADRLEASRLFSTETMAAIAERQGQAILLEAAVQQQLELTGEEGEERAREAAKQEMMSASTPLTFAGCVAGAGLAPGFSAGASEEKQQHAVAKDLQEVLAAMQQYLRSLQEEKAVRESLMDALSSLVEKASQDKERQDSSSSGASLLAVPSDAESNLAAKTQFLQQCLSSRSASLAALQRVQQVKQAALVRAKALQEEREKEKKREEEEQRQMQALQEQQLQQQQQMNRGAFAAPAVSNTGTSTSVQSLLSQAISSASTHASTSGGAAVQAFSAPYAMLQYSAPSAVAGGVGPRPAGTAAGAGTGGFSLLGGGHGASPFSSTSSAVGGGGSLMGSAPSSSMPVSLQYQQQLPQHYQQLQPYQQQQQSSMGMAYGYILSAPAAQAGQAQAIPSQAYGAMQGLYSAPTAPSYPSSGAYFVASSAVSAPAAAPAPRLQSSVASAVLYSAPQYGHGAGSGRAGSSSSSFASGGAAGGSYPSSSATPVLSSFVTPSSQYQQQQYQHYQQPYSSSGSATAGAGGAGGGGYPSAYPSAPATASYAPAAAPPSYASAPAAAPGGGFQQQQQQQQPSQSGRRQVLPAWMTSGQGP